jgi:hypothetical protein
VPAVVFSEAMRDIGLVIGVAGIGGDLAELERAGGSLETLGDTMAEMWGTGVSTKRRRDALADLLPKTSIAGRWMLAGPWLVVSGNRGTYRIHLRTGAVFVEPDGRFLHIVPKPKQPDRIFLPFEQQGGLLSEIVSKAFLLADDEHITVREMLKQLPPIGGPGTASRLP